jgi:hypothetical protein
MNYLRILAFVCVLALHANLVVAAERRQHGKRSFSHPSRLLLIRAATSTSQK